MSNLNKDSLFLENLKFDLSKKRKIAARREKARLFSHYETYKTREKVCLFSTCILYPDNRRILCHLLFFLIQKSLIFAHILETSGKI